MKERDEILRSPTTTAAFAMLGKELPGDTQVRLETEVLPVLIRLQEQLSSLQDELESWGKGV